MDGRFWREATHTRNRSRRMKNSSQRRSKLNLKSSRSIHLFRYQSAGKRPRRIPNRPAGSTLRRQDECYRNRRRPVRVLTEWMEPDVPALAGPPLAEREELYDFLVAERVGQSPAELLTGQTHPHWLELLGYTRFHRNGVAHGPACRSNPGAIPFGRQAHSPSTVTQNPPFSNQAVLSAWSRSIPTPAAWLLHRIRPSATPVCARVTPLPWRHERTCRFSLRP